MAVRNKRQTERNQLCTETEKVGKYSQTRKRAGAENNSWRWAEEPDRQNRKVFISAPGRAGVRAPQGVCAQGKTTHPLMCEPSAVVW